MKLSEHFTVEEFEYSDTARAKGISNKMTEAQKKEAVHTCVYMLEPARKILNDTYKTYNGKPVNYVSIKITSGFRGSLLNEAVRGSSTSAHCKAQAADIEATLVFKDGTKRVLSYNETYQTLKGAVKAGKLVVDQIIRECTTKNGKILATWVHLGFKSQIKDCRKQCLIYKDGKYTLDN